MEFTKDKPGEVIKAEHKEATAEAPHVQPPNAKSVKQTETETKEKTDETV